MKLIRVEQARAGQKAARDIIDLRGNVLLKAGAALDAGILDRCRERNVTHVFIEEAGAAAGASGGGPEKKIEEVARDVDRMFAGVDGTPLMAALREASKRYLQGKAR